MSKKVIESEYYSNSDDAALVDSVLNGSGEAFAELVNRYRDLVFAAISGYVRDEYMAEEIAQDSFVDAFIGLSKLREPAKFAPWIYGIAKRKAQHAVTRRRYTEDIDELQYAMADYLNPEEEIISDERRLAVRAAVGGLSPKNKVVVEMYYLEEMPIQRISEKLGISQGTIKSRLYEARNKLKGALESMEVNRPNAEKFEQNIFEKIYKAMVYYRVYGENSSEFSNLYEEIRKLINNESDPEKKKKAQERFYGNIWSSKYKTQEVYNDILKENNPAKFKAREFAYKMWDSNENCDHLIATVNEAMLDPEIRACPESSQLLFWRGRAYLEKRMITEAREDFEAALKIAEPDDIHRALSRVALNELDLLSENCNDPVNGLNVTSERYIKDGRSVYFYNQPGFGTKSILWQLHSSDYINYFVSRCCDTFFNTDLKSGESIIDEEEDSVLTHVGYDEKLTVPAGTFEGCMKLHYSSTQYNADIWYGKNVGLLKVIFYEGLSEEIYELSEYEIHGGSGYFPFAIGNRWRYNNPKIPDYLFARFENEIDWTDGVACTMMCTHLVAYRKGFDENSIEDANLKIERCIDLSEAKDLNGAIDELKSAVQMNTNIETTTAALYGIEYLKKCIEVQKNEYRLCPSSFNLSTIFMENHGINYHASSFTSFGPYRFGSRFEENRIFGIKIFRYLQDITNHMWSDKWQAGYVEEREGNMFGTRMLVSIKVQDGGTIETAAGKFDNTLCVEIDARDPSMEGNYYFDDNYSYVWAGIKKYWFVQGVGIVRLDCIWGDALSSSAELIEFYCPAAREDEYMPIEIGNRWVYEEKNLAAEGYHAIRDMAVRAGMADRYLLTDNQEFWYLGTEEEYEEAKKSGFKRGE